MNLMDIVDILTARAILCEEKREFLSREEIT